MKYLLFLALIFVGVGVADSLKIAAGAGYKKPVQEVVKLYEARHHEKVEALYGNMAQVFAQAKQTDIALIVADKKFLVKQNGLSFSEYLTIGKGRAVVAYAKGVKLDKVEEIADAKIARIAMPESQKAIYGQAGMEFLQNAKLMDRLKERLLVVATVPQVASYVSTHEVDVGIMNLTAALDTKAQIGGYIEIPQDYYTPIEIVAGHLPACQNNASCQKFSAFLKTPEAQTIFASYGL